MNNRDKLQKIKSNLNNISILVEKVRNSLDIIMDIKTIRKLNNVCGNIQTLIMKEQDKGFSTGQATICLDANTGDKHWRVYDEGDKEPFNMNIGEYLQFNPEAFEEETIIKI